MDLKIGRKSETEIRVCEKGKRTSQKFQRVWRVKKLVISESSQTDVRNDKSVKSDGFVAIGWQSLARLKIKEKKNSIRLDTTLVT